jgi:hypothetical protein
MSWLGTCLVRNCIVAFCVAVTNRAKPFTTHLAYALRARLSIRCKPDAWMPEYVLFSLDCLEYVATNSGLISFSATPRIWDMASGARISLDPFCMCVSIAVL